MLKLLLIDIRNYLKLLFFRKKWRKLNVKNFTNATNIFPLSCIKEIGNYTYGDLEIRYYNKCNSQISIGSFCSIARNVVFLLSAEHQYKGVTTYPYKTFLLNQNEDEHVSKGNIIIEDDVWIGENVTILSGVKINRGAIISAGSIVVKDVPPYAIYGNFKILKYRFDEEKIKQLMKIDYKAISNLNSKEAVNYFNELEEKYEL